MDKKIKKTPEEEAGQPKVYGDPVYSADEDIYSKGEKVELRDSGDGAEPGDRAGAGKGAGTGKGTKTVKGAANSVSPGEDLDVPGAELDDQDEEIGEEDEENNYYSLGGDDHDDLEEDKGD